MRRNRIHDELIERMGETEPYRSLRRQKEQIEHEEEEAARRSLYDLQVNNLRREIKRRGHKPVA